MQIKLYESDIKVSSASRLSEGKSVASHGTVGDFVILYVTYINWDANCSKFHANARD